MQSTNDQKGHHPWTSVMSVFLLKWMSIVGQYIYIIWFSIHRVITGVIQQRISLAFGAIYGMIFLEGHTVCKVMWYTWKKYDENPSVYGLNQWNETNCHHRPVLLIHGAAGSWAYLGDLAVALKNARIPVFTIDLGFGLPTDEMRRKINQKIDEIRRLYPKPNQSIEIKPNLSPTEPRPFLYTIQEETPSEKSINFNNINPFCRKITHSNDPPLVDLIAHSNGGNIALYSAFTENCSSIDQQADLKFRSELQANPNIGKIITIALPSNQIETNWLREINKINDLYNINAKYDALMAYKECSLVKELPSHVQYVNAAHIGIVFDPTIPNRILRILFQ